MPVGGRPTVRSRRLGSALRRYREEARLDQQQAAEYIAGSTSKISRIESGESAARPGDVRLLLELYGVEDELARRQLEQLARDSNKRGWWLDHQSAMRPDYADVIALETDATYIRSWQSLYLPGLLQTPYYTRALNRAAFEALPADELERHVTIRDARKRIIADGGTQFAAVIWEPALTSPLPDAEAHREQLAHVRAVAERQNVSIQVLPHTAWTAAHMTSHFVIYGLGPAPLSEAVAFDTTTESMVLDDPEQAARLGHIFETLQTAALTPAETLSFLDQAIKSTPTSEKG